MMAFCFEVKYSIHYKTIKTSGKTIKTSKYSLF